MGEIVYLNGLNEEMQKSLNTVQKQVVKVTAESFSKDVTELVWKEDISYFDAITHLMSERQLEPEHVAKLLTSEVVSELTIELEKSNYLPKSEVNRLF